MQRRTTGGQTHRQKIRFELTDAEVKLLATMAENELFRMRFVNPRMPGYILDHELLRHCQAVTIRLSEMTKKQKGVATPDVHTVIRPDADAL